MQLAIALYNNHVDDEEELEFRKGDLLTVLIENPHGLDGWWLCQRRGKCGLCPGNRLKLLPASNSTARDSADLVRFPSHFSTASVSTDCKSRKAGTTMKLSVRCTMDLLPLTIMTIHRHAVRPLLQLPLPSSTISVL